MAMWADPNTPFVDVTYDAVPTLEVRSPVITAPTPIRIRPRRRLYARVIKAAGDRFFALLLLAFLLPVVALIAVLIRMTMGRGVLFRQQRVGQGGQQFTMVKFRTMEPDRRVQSAPWLEDERRVNHKSGLDPRHTRVGRFLRRFSLDEIPNLWNVVRGEMSLVGPRPELPSVVATYVDWQHLRHLVKPGITGLWQVSNRNIMMHECIEVDVEYVRRLSMLTDIWILLRTVPSAVRGSGS